jgi:2-polyprenyl-3-methyl-5-hydroxy-6-metoxy-1,4-benzoquinol methylase
VLPKTEADSMTQGRVQTEIARSPFADDDRASVMGVGRDFEYATCDNEFSFVRAERSGLVFLRERPTAAELGTIYPDHYEPYRFESFPGMVRRAREFVQRGKVAAVRRLAGGPAQILDVGCGSGALLRLLRDHGDRRWSLHANELHPPSLERLAQDGFNTHPGPVEAIAGQSRFDVIILNQVIEHFADVAGLVATCRRLLKPNGQLLIETPSTSGLDFALFSRRHWGGYHFPRHFYLFSAETLTRLLAENGLEVREVRYLASPAFWTQSLHHRISESRFRRLAPWFHLTNIPLTAAVTLFDLAWAAVGGRTSNMRVVARRLP